MANQSAGLRGQSAGSTALSTVGKEGKGLTYRGYAIEDLAENCEFEEVAYLLLHGHLPNKYDLGDFSARLIEYRDLPEDLKLVLQKIPATAHPMDVLRTACSFLGNINIEGDFSRQYQRAEELLAKMPSIIGYWWRYVNFHEDISLQTEEEHLAGHFLNLIHQQEFPSLWSKVLNVSLILYAEHEFNASTFAARVCASTLSDFHSCITSAIGTLRGPLHGGANERAMELLEEIGSRDKVEDVIHAKFTKKEKIMGFGHAVYRDSDPRSAIIEKWAEKLTENSDDPYMAELLAIAKACDRIMHTEKKLFPNADFYHAPAYRCMNIPTPLFTPIFVCSRITGWSAHIVEQRQDNHLIRPSADYIGEGPRKVIPITER